LILLTAALRNNLQRPRARLQPGRLNGTAMNRLATTSCIAAWAGPHCLVRSPASQRCWTGRPRADLPRWPSSPS